MFQKILFLLALVVLLPLNTLAQDSSYRRNDDAASESAQPNGGQMRASSNLFGEVFTLRKRGTNVCSSAATGTGATAIIAAVSSAAHYVNSIRCHNNSTVASAITFSNGATAFDSDLVGTTTLGNNKAVREYVNPVKLNPNTALNFTMGTTATSTVCCANYVSYAAVNFTPTPTPTATPTP